jgi:hypothetical protein
MRTGLFAFIVMAVAPIATAAFTTSLLGACATNEAASIDDPADAALGEDAADAGEAGDAPSDAPCEDCEYFPEACTDDVLCANGPFGTGGFDPRTQITTIVGRGATDVWVAGGLGAVAHFDGTKWTRLDLGSKETLSGLWLADGAVTSVVTLTRFYGRDGDAGDWSLREPPTRPAAYDWWTRTLRSTWAAPSSPWMWGATENDCASIECLFDKELRPSGVWRLRASPDSPDAQFEIHDGIPPDVCQELRCGNMTAIHGWSADDLWAVGNLGTTIRITDAESEAPTVRAFNSQTWDAFHGVWAASASDAWAVGSRGLVRHYTGHPTRWDVVSDVPTLRDLRAVSGSSPSDVWAVGDEGVVLHYDGKAWSRVKIAGLGRRRPKLSAVWVAGPDRVWIGGQGVVLTLGGKP